MWSRAGAPWRRPRRACTGPCPGHLPAPAPAAPAALLVIFKKKKRKGKGEKKKVDGDSESFAISMILLLWLMRPTIRSTSSILMGVCFFFLVAFVFVFVLFFLSQTGEPEVRAGLAEEAGRRGGHDLDGGGKLGQGGCHVHREIGLDQHVAPKPGRCLLQKKKKKKKNRKEERGKKK